MKVYTVNVYTILMSYPVILLHLSNHVLSISQVSTAWRNALP